MTTTTSSLGTLDLSPLTEDELLAFYGALFAMSAADRSIDESETERIFESLHMDELSPEARRRVLAFNIQPPNMEDCLLAVRDAEFSIRRGLMLNLMDIVLADNSIEPGEHEGLIAARQILGVTNAEMVMIHEAAYAIQNNAALKGVKRPFRILD